MLSNDVQQLLVGYVDAELTPQQWESASRFLKQSAEAREFVLGLQADADALRKLPRRQLAPGFPEKVLGAINDRRLHGSRHAKLAQASVYPAWIGVAAAAAVVFVVGIGALVYLYSMRDQKQKIAVAKNEANRSAKSSEAGAVIKEKENSPAPNKEKAPPPESSASADVAASGDKSISSDNRPVLEFTTDANVVTETEPVRRLEVFKELEQVELSLSYSLRDLDQPRLQERLKAMLTKDKAFHLTLACPSTAKGLERLQSAFQAKGVKLLIDKAALTRWQKGLKTHYALYSEDVTPEELTAILQALGADDKKADSKQRFNKAVINHLTPANRGEICTLLGVDPQAKSAKSKGPLGVDITQPLSKKTEEQLADSLAGKGNPRPEPGKAAAPKTPDRVALVLSYNPVRISPASSKEVKQFLATRPAQRPGALQILLVLRGS